MISARFRLALPADMWVVAVSTAFPDASFRLLTGVPVGERAIELGEVVGPSAAAAVEAIRDHPDVLACDRLYVGDRRALTRYESTEQRLYEFLGGTSVPPEFPVVVENGVMTFTLTTTSDRFDALGDALDASDLDYELLSVVDTDPSEDLLTTRQRECLAVAVREGYFEVPRECTLADLSATLGVDKSTASETLRRAEARLVKRFLLEATE